MFSLVERHAILRERHKRAKRSVRCMLLVRSAAKAAVLGKELRGCFLIFAIMDDRKTNPQI